MEKGRILARGRGMGSMLAISKQQNLNNENTILEVKDPTDLNSWWVIREKK